MRFLKLGIISIVFFALLITGISLLLPSTIYISRAIDINSPVDSVYEKVSNLAIGRVGMPGYDSSIASLSSSTTGAGAKLTLNKTTIKILDVSPAQVKALWQGSTNNPLPGEFNFISQEGAPQMTLQWKFTHTVKWYPWEKFASIISDKAIGPVMEKSLENLKNSLEKS
jgi:hypothetical protein